MYLDFIIDLVSEGTCITIECGNEKINGSIVKVNKNLIAINTGKSIIIKKDEEITSVPIINSSDSESLTDATPEKIVKTAIPEKKDDIEDTESSFGPLTAEEMQEKIDKNIVSEEYGTSDKENFVSTNTLENSPQIKIVGKINLDAIPENNRSRFPSKLIGKTTREDKMPEDLLTNSTNPKGGLVSNEEHLQECKNLTMGEYDIAWDIIDTKELNICINIIKKFTSSEEKSLFVNSNATVVETRKKTFKIVTSYSEKPLVVQNKTMVERKLFEELSSFQVGDILPIVILLNKENTNKVILALTPANISYYLDLLENCLGEMHFQQAKLICYLLLNHIESTNARKAIMRLLAALRPVNAFLLSNPRRESNEISDEIHKIPKQLKDIEKSLNALIAAGDIEQALMLINEVLKDKNIESKYVASLLLKRAQAFSSLNRLNDAEEAYVELINHTLKNNGKPNNISHLYTELARLQSSHDVEQAICSIKKSLQYNSANKFAETLLVQLQSNAYMDSREVAADIVLYPTVNSISKMLSVDISEYEFSSSAILNNNGIVTSNIAIDLFELAKLEDKYPAYLEAAKAFQELNIGSYDTKMYLSAVSNYAKQKANYIFSKFKLLVYSRSDDNNIQIKELCRLKDSACSYYIESLNLFEEIEASTLLSILGNYLIMEVAYYRILNKMELTNLFNSSFAEIFVECISSKDYQLEKIVYKTLVSIGSSSLAVWNKLSEIQGGTGRLYAALGHQERKEHIFQVINEVECSDINITQKPSDFLTTSFKQRQDKTKALQKWLATMSSIGLSFYQMEQVEALWSKVKDYEYLFLPTDTEVKSKMDTIISILLPYSSRNPEERTNLMLQAQKIIATQCKFISENTTYYGRTIFYPLLQKWNENIESLYEEKIAKAQPILKVSLDPSYYVEDNNEKFLNIVVTNIGSSTSEGFTMDFAFSNEYIQAIQYRSQQEIPTKGRSIARVKINTLKNIETFGSIDVVITTRAIYQEKTLEPSNTRFTIEKEPESKLGDEDIVWNYGRVTESNLFKGRQQILSDLVYHYKSIDRDKSYILYGLTRTGKTSILKYLEDEIDGARIRLQGKEYVVCTFLWELNEAAEYKKASDFWEYVLYTQIFDHLEKYGIDTTGYKFPTQPRAKDFVLLLTFLHNIGYYPLILVDEFSYIKTLMDDKVINSAFLAAIRQHSLNGLASFIFAGTYDIKDLIRNPKYGITGQLVNSIEMQINEIPKEDAEDLINVMQDKLIFSPEAISHIHKLSGDIPYFIQMICKYCGYYAVENKRRTIGYPDLENVIRKLTGEDKETTQRLKCLPENVFQNNQYNASDPQEVKALISSITYLSKTKSVYARPVGVAELQQLWGEKKVGAFSHKLATSLGLLLEKKIIIQSEDDGLPVYEFSVDLFRRWWAVHHSDIDLVLTSLELASL